MERSVSWMRLPLSSACSSSPSPPSQVLPTKSILIGDGGDFIATASYVVRPRGPLCWLDPGAFGTLGTSISLLGAGPG